MRMFRKSSPRLVRTEFQGTGVHRKGHIGLRSSADVAQSAIPTRESISMRVERFYDVMSQLNGKIQPADEEVLGSNDNERRQRPFDSAEINRRPNGRPDLLDLRF